ncbi:copper chaperone PCu(A)C [Nonomuraea sp. NPDC049504]|uniref:copper chaperone PCu(A)C n=1 Tax=Nonomuraea sp. NPDC049504 TaxID=3154729 RepID=UPI003413DFBD
MLMAMLLALTACGDDTPYSVDEFSPNVGANASVNGMLLRNAFILGGESGDPLDPGSDAPLYLTLVNQGSQKDRLVSVSSPGHFTGSRMNGDWSVPPDGMAGGGPVPQATLTGLAKPLPSGSYIPVVFTFQHAGQTRKQIPVLPPSQWRTQSPVTTSN